MCGKKEGPDVQGGWSGIKEVGTKDGSEESGKD